MVASSALPLAGGLWGLWKFWPEQGLRNDCRAAVPAWVARHPVLEAAWAGIDPARVWDCHVHLVGMGDSAPELIVVRHIQPGHDFSLTITLASGDNGTELTWEMNFSDPTEGERVRPFVVPANEQNFDRLTAHLTANP